MFKTSTDFLSLRLSERKNYSSPDIYFYFFPIFEFSYFHIFLVFDIRISINYPAPLRLTERVHIIAAFAIYALSFPAAAATTATIAGAAS